MEEIKEGLNGTDRREQNRRRKNKPFNRFTKFWSIIFLLATFALGGMIYYIDILETKLLIFAVCMLAFFWILLFPPLFSWRFKKSRKIIALFLSSILIFGYSFGVYAMAKSLSFLHEITTIDEKEDNFSLVVERDSSYDKISDLDGKRIIVAAGEGPREKKLEKKLKDAGNFRLTFYMDREGSLDSIENKACEGVLIRSSQYEEICIQKPEYKEKLKVIGKIGIPLQETDIRKEVDVTKESFNIYISGLDVEGGIETVSRSDVNMIITINPKTHTLLITSIPRDFYVEVPGTKGAKDKLTHTGIFGVDKTVKAAENLLGIDINYYVKVNYNTVKAVVDSIGGIEVNSDYDFSTHGMGVYYEFKKGINELDGDKALAFARERKSFADGDLQRNKNQQKVFEGVFRKMISFDVISKRYSDILDSVQKYVETNLGSKDIRNLIKLQLSNFKGWHLQKQSLTGELGMSSTYTAPNLKLSVLYPDKDSLREAKAKIEAVSQGK